MATLLGKVIADFTTSLATAMAVGATSVTLQSATDDDGVALPSGTYFFTIDGGNSSKEHIACSLSGTSLTSIKSISRQGVQTVGTARAHRIGATVTLTDFAHLKYINDLLDGTTNLDASNPLEYDGTASITGANQLATKGYVDSVVGGSANYDQNLITGTAGETLAAGNVVYFKESDSRWWKTDSDAAATAIGVRLGVAQGSATAGNNVTVLVAGLEKNLSGLTTGTKYYLGATAGAITTTPGTFRRFVGTAVSTTRLLWGANTDPLNVGQDGRETYAVDAGSTDAYAITLSPAPTALVDGMVIRFKANTINTGNATLNVNGIGAKNILKSHDQTLANGDIEAGQIVSVVYSSADDNFQMLSQTGQATITTTDVQVFTSNGTWTKPANALWADVILIGGGGGGGSGRRGVANSDRAGGAGGGGGAYTRNAFRASALGSTETVTIGAGGAGGAAISSDNTNGNAGADGGVTSFGSLLRALGGSGGGGGTTADATGGAGATPSLKDGASGGAGKFNASAVNGSNGYLAGAGGGGGSGNNTGNGSNRAGGVGGSQIATNTSGGTAGTAPGGAGGASTNQTAPTGGPGGGGGSVHLTGAGGAGGDGGDYGGGGGGGGSSANGNSAGKGGDGGEGYAIVITHLA